MNDTALAALQRSLSEYREAKRKIQLKLADLEMESASLRSQIIELDAMIEQNETSLLRILLPGNKPIAASGTTSGLPFDYKSAPHSATHHSTRYRPSEISVESEIE